MSAFNDFFNAGFVINLASNATRWAHAQDQIRKFDLKNVMRFDGYEAKDYRAMPFDGMHNAMGGCTTSHGAILHMAAHHRWPVTLVLEDDFEIVHPDFHSKFESMIELVPKDWDVIYLGAHYGEKPMERVNANVIRGNLILTTSSYLITGAHARRVAPYMCGCSPPDHLLSGFAPFSKHYVLQPRLMVQYANLSDIWGKFTDNSQCMLDPNHEAMV